jgi:hypothetical protein
MKTLLRVAAEMALYAQADNLTRVMNIIGIEPLIAAIRGIVKAEKTGSIATSPSLSAPEPKTFDAAKTHSVISDQHWFKGSI